MELLIKSIEVKLERKNRRNNYQDHSQIFLVEMETINKKILILEKGKEKYTISDFIDFPTTSKYNSVYPPNVYNSFEKHGLFEAKESTIDYKLCPSSYMGLVSIDYYLDIELKFDSLLTSDEKINIPLYFSSNFDNNNINQKVQTEGIINPLPAANNNVASDCSYSSYQSNIINSINNKGFNPK